MGRTSKVASLSVITFLSIIVCGLSNDHSCYAAIFDFAATDASSISPIDTSTTTPSASLSLSKTSVTSDTVMPGSTAIATTGVTVSVSNASSYSLTFSVDDATLKNGATIVKPGDVATDNTWGYQWELDTDTGYKAPTTTGTSLTVPVLNDNAASFTNKTLTFAAKFSNEAESGHYSTNGKLSLIVTPKSITLENLTEMQQMTSEICANTPYLAGQKYSKEYTLKDVRDHRTYTVRKLDDGKCWMTSNLALSNTSLNITYGSNTYATGVFTERILNPTTSDVTEDWTLPGSSVAGFSDNTAINTYTPSAAIAGATGYYTWCAATAGCKTQDGANPDASEEAVSSICPKGWKIPTGGSGGDFQTLYNAAGITSDSVGSAKLRDTPYNFTYTGYIFIGTDYTKYTNGYWWSRTASSDTGAYILYIDDNDISQTGADYRRLGVAVRCVAE